jgi:hypothetical protein
MERKLNIDSDRSPAARAMDEAIELAIEGRSPYPDRRRRRGVGRGGDQERR